MKSTSSANNIIEPKLRQTRPVGILLLNTYEGRAKLAECEGNFDIDIEGRQIIGYATCPTAMANGIV
jgi:hypothetical protein